MRTNKCSLESLKKINIFLHENSTRNCKYFLIYGKLYINNCINMVHNEISVKKIIIAKWCWITKEIIFVVVVVQSLSCATLYDPVDCHTPGFPVLHYLPVLTQIHEFMMPSSYLILCCPVLLPSIFPESGSFPMTQLFASGGQRIRASVSSSVFHNIPFDPQRCTSLLLVTLSEVSQSFLLFQYLLNMHDFII